jgi:Domain of unknown function (DUF4267)
MSNIAPDTTVPANMVSSRSVGWWLAYIAVVLAVVTSAAFGVLCLFAPATFLGIVGERTVQVNAGAQVLAAYTGARELAIAITLLVLLVTRASRGLAAVMLLTALANVFDFGHAVIAQRWVQAPGALVFAIIYLAAAVWLFNRPARREIG